MTLETINYHSDHGVYLALIKEGRKHIHLVSLGVPVRIVKLKQSERVRMQPCPSVSTERMSKHLLGWGKRYGITQSAKKMLEGK